MKVRAIGMFNRCWQYLFLSVSLVDQLVLVKVAEVTW